MVNRAVKIYSHKKQKDGTWTMLPMSISVDSRSTKTVPGSFSVTLGSSLKVSCAKWPGTRTSWPARCGRVRGRALHYLLDALALKDITLPEAALLRVNVSTMSGF